VRAEAGKAKLSASVAAKAVCIAGLFTAVSKSPKLEAFTAGRLNASSLRTTNAAWALEVRGGSGLVEVEASAMGAISVKVEVAERANVNGTAQVVDVEECFVMVLVLEV